MGVFDRAGNLLKGFLRKPLEALERSASGEAQLDRELEEQRALERARARVDELDQQAKPETKPPAKPEPSEEKPRGKSPRRMGPDDGE